MHLFQKVKASSLTFTLLIFTLIVTVLMGIVLLNYFFNRNFAKKIERLESLNNCQSGLNYLLGEKSYMNMAILDSVISLNKDQDSICVKSYPWGAYNIIESSVKNNSYRIKKLAMVSNYIFSDTSTTLFLTNVGRSLCLCLNTNIDGFVAIPEAGIKYTLMNGSSFTGNEVQKNNQRLSNDRLPELNDYFNELTIDYLISVLTDTSSINYADVEKSHSKLLTNTFDKPTQWVFSDELFTESNYTGKIVVFADSLLKITNDNTLNDIIIIAKDIIIEEGFRGAIQCFAKNSITLEKNVVLEYPSGLFLLTEKNEEIYETEKAIEINEGSEVEGIVFSNINITSNYDQLKLNLKQESTIKGIVYWTGSINLKGKVDGQIFTNSFYIKNAFGFYNNYISNGTITRNSDINNIGFPGLFETDNIGTIVKWL